MYTSTRSPNISSNSYDAILDGLCEDGGLYVLPDLEDRNINLSEIVNLDYKDQAFLIFKTLLSDFSEEELKECINNAYTNTFENDEISPLKKIGDIYVMELFHGPTSAFKDVALQMLPQLMSVALSKKQTKALILTATSGDTGKAAMSGFANVPNTGICVYYPHGGVSEIQYRQMATQQGSNVDVFAIRGNFDDAQSNVKKLFLDEEIRQYALSKNIKLSSANSINIGRLVPQIVYYFNAYKQLIASKVINFGDKISFTVPTGNFGDILAGYYAKELGLPIEKLVVACNKNDVLNDFFHTGTYDSNRDFYKTTSPSMDILVSSNLERLLYYASGQNTEAVAAWMADLKNFGKYTIDNQTFAKIRETFDSGVVNEQETNEIIAKVFNDYGYVLDTHSAVGYGIASAKCGEVPMVTLSTASPYKFPNTVVSACGEICDDEWEALDKLKALNKIQPCPDALSDLKNADILHNNIIDCKNMKNTVVNAIDKLSQL